MALGPWQIAIIVMVVLVLFGRGKISNLMGDVGQGISAFKKGLTDNGPDDMSVGSGQQGKAEKRSL